MPPHYPAILLLVESDKCRGLGGRAPQDSRNRTGQIHVVSGVHHSSEELRKYAKTG
jgi:hypothetical protein